MRPDAGRLGHLPVHGRLDLARQGRAGGKQDGRRVLAVLGLGQQVGGDEGRLRRVVGDDQHLRRAGRAIDGDRQAAAGGADFGGHHVHAARAENLVHRRHALRSVGHGGNGLRAARLEYVADAHAVGGGQHDRRQAAVFLRRHAQHAALAARHHGGNAEHQNGGGIERLAAGGVEADPFDGSPQAPGAHAGLQLVQVLVGELAAMEALEVVARPLQAGQNLRRHPAPGLGDLVLADAYVVHGGAVEARGVFPQGRVAALAHVRHDVPHLRHDALHVRPGALHEPSAGVRRQVLDAGQLHAFRSASRVVPAPAFRRAHGTSSR